MEYMPASQADLGNVFAVVQNTINTVYPKLYQREIVDFFWNIIPWII